MMLFNLCFFFLCTANPPPPTGLQPKEVDINHVILTWSPPHSKQYFVVTNFTVQFRRSASRSFQDAEVIGAEITERAVRDLEPDTDYVFRILANNNYGSGASEELKITTNEGTYIVEFHCECFNKPVTFLPNMASLLIDNNIIDVKYYCIRYIFTYQNKHPTVLHCTALQCIPPLSYLDCNALFVVCQLHFILDKFPSF